MREADGKTASAVAKVTHPSVMRLPAEDKNNLFAPQILGAVFEGGDPVNGPKRLHVNFLECDRFTKHDICRNNLSDLDRINM